MLTVKDIVSFKFTGLLLVFGIAVGGVVLGPQKIRKRVHPPQVAWRFPIEMQNKVAFSKLRIYTGPEIFKKGAVVRIATIKGKDALRATTPWIRLHRGRNIHDLVLPSRSFDNLVMEIGGEFDRKPFLQTKIVSKAIADFWGGYLWVAALISTALLLPGVMLTALFKTQDRLKAPAVIWLAPFALVFHTLVFFSVILWRQTGHYPGAPTAVSVWVVCVLLTLAVTCRLRGLDALIGTTRKVFKDASFYLTIVLAATFIVAHDTPLPFQNLTHKSISGPKTFGAFRAHDPWFQYANALSIEEGVPLRTHYRKQVYRPEDREILPGIIAGFGQMVIGSISGYLGKSYLTYTIIGTACNALLVFPLLVLSRRFFPKDSPYLLMTLFSLNAYVIVYYYMTVFKMAGGALFLSALILLLYGHDIRSWILSGSVMALGTNMHAGVALGIPLFFLVFIVLHLRHHPKKGITALMGPLSFVAAFTVLNAPWKLYKSLYLGNRIIMFQEHFLYGYGNGKDLWASIRLFLETVPLFAQLPLRISTLAETMGYGIPQGLIGRFDIHYLGVLDIWNKLEFVRFPYLIAIPVSMTVLTLGWLLVRRQSLRVWYGQSIAHGAEVLTFLCCGYLSLTLLSFVYFSTHKVWSTTYQPSGLITLVFFLLVGIAWQGPPWVKGVYAIVGGFSLLRFLTFLL